MLHKLALYMSCDSVAGHTLLASSRYNPGITKWRGTGNTNKVELVSVRSRIERQ